MEHSQEDPNCILYGTYTDIKASGGRELQIQYIKYGF
jgi:hypothetical protein